jgi:hypothetical protein
MELSQRSGEHMIVMSVQVTQSIQQHAPKVFVGTQYWHPMEQYMHPIILFSILAAWPKIALRDRFKLFCLALPFLFFIELVDIPLRTVSRCQQSLAASSSPEGAATPVFFLYWVHFLDGGGREFLSVLAACLTAGCFFLLRALQRPEPDPKDLCPCGSGKKYKRCCMKYQKT